MIRILSILFLSLAVRTQAAAYNYYGAGCGQMGEPPAPGVLWATGSPTLGGTVTVGWTGPYFQSARAQVFPYLVTGTSRNSLSGTPLPWRIPEWLVNFGGLDCDLLCSAEMGVESMFGGTRSRTFAIPNQSSLIGVRLYQQYWLWYFVTGPLIFDFWIVTNGGEMVVGR